MPQLIKDRAIVDDRWTLVRDVESLSTVPSEATVIVPLAYWTQQRDTLRARGNVGVWLAPNDDPAELVDDIGRLPLIAVDFPQFIDGRGYSIGRLLRDRFGFKGELRAIGDILRDQLYYLHACGFDAFAVRADRNLADALKGLADFSDNYQTTAEQPLPLFRRRDSRVGGNVAPFDQSDPR
jgi:uncharacterized protein (DUF934 family)